MTPGPSDRDDPTSPDDPELGLPVTELGDLSWNVDSRFTEKVRGKIERRLLAGELLELASASLTMLVELLRLPFELIAGKRRR